MSGILNSFVGASYGTKPYAPTIGTATVTGSTTATVSYTAPTNDGGSTILRYTATSSPGGITGVLNTAASGTISVSGLTPNTAYTFTVTATNAAGTSVPSAASNSINTYYAPVNTVAPVVSGGNTYGNTLSTTTGTWNGLPTPGYSYQWQRGGSNISSATNSTYTLAQADVGYTISCVVTATNAAGSNSANSNSTATVVATLPGTPTSVLAVNAGSYYGAPAATVSWTTPDNGGSDIINYRIVWSGGSGNYTSNPALITGLVPGAFYNFGVTALNSVGYGGQGLSNGIITPL
jgi:hypothetical protein